MSRLPFKLAACGSFALLLASCSSTRAPEPVTPTAPIQQGGGISGPSDFNRPHKDGAPWWDVDVSKIPDAVPMPHYGPVKASPYTVFGKQYYPIPDARRYQSVGPASWYGTKFHGQATANGETYDLYGMTAAHKTLPLPSYVRTSGGLSRAAQCRWYWLRRSRSLRLSLLHNPLPSQLSNIHHRHNSMPPRCSPCRLTQKKTL
jgi:rare lipoprotein A